MESKLEPRPAPITEVKYGTPYKPPEPKNLEAEKIYNELQSELQQKTEKALEVFFAPLMEDNPEVLKRHDKYFSKILRGIKASSAN